MNYHSQTSADRGSNSEGGNTYKKLPDSSKEHCTESDAHERSPRSQVTENYTMGSECRIRHLQGNRIIAIHDKLMNLPGMVMDVQRWWSFR